MNESDNLSPTSDEKLLAAAAHFFGVIAALFVWAYQKDKSRFAKFQALQALSFDFIVMVTMLLFLFCMFGSIFIGMSLSMFAVVSSPSSPDETIVPFMMFPFAFPFAIFGCVMPVSLALMIPRLVAAISVLNGRDFRYPWLGKWLERFLRKG